MALPVFNFAANVSTNITICEIHPGGSVVFGLYAASPRIFLPAGVQNQSPVIDLASYLIVGGSSGVGTIVTFQEFGGDGNWRALVSPAPITIASSTSYNGVLNGPFHGLRISISGVVGNGVGYAELVGSVRSQ
jgi:hypothetical protein